ncbi:isopeptide-forming domain-containing fimbrial protein [Bifidobacterium dentium]|uniref:Sortase-anchored surface protein n=1 Tax=Bifidobacterium dentium (strain ATCC 27534 / DSM 20436 / JCM 1195 / Bd1) TaxID=401473 RepID=D2Q7Y6_BIFDB|nr:isopeptide-forming domain-containing fimbrial protein [Bifidobacterium dentium]ADB08957.1 Putative sortase-anchored surface protein [Bifidobacterium dentium Bd1]EDT44712.1 LPXTG-motif cell wall anchor domain protein [Bifidobacterium dentium ATCC 27678]SEB93253.1 LPXTG-motif cell wall anchor domain-containing protein/fimbrial isopeptide formation D2 domain-containing protein [Bifidobacterium dentium JCM 1195 = DSM 20436]VEG22931.1 sortase-anchored surface protein [Bifidobacterium dentium]BAQ
MKRAINALVAVLATVAMAVAGFMGAGTAFADEANTITGPKNGHTYEAYQIFTGDLADGKLSNVKWGSATAKNGTAVTDAELKTVTDLASKSVNDNAQATANAIAAYLKSDAQPTATIDDTNPTAQVPSGYYLIKDKNNTVPDGQAATTYIVTVAGNVTITPKSDVPSFEKKLKDTNDTTGETSDWQDSADYDINDAVPFKLEGTVASNYADYDTYYFAFHDVEENSLTFNKDSVKVYVDDTEITSGYSVVTEGLTDDCTFEVKFANLKTIDGVKAGSKIRVEYTSTLNENAVLGKHGNVNKAKLQFSNNPNDSQNGETSPTGETPWDNVIVFTYKTVINKVDDKNQPLKGAEFTLSKKMKDGSTKTVAVVKDSEGTTFTFNGLDDGDYVLTETKTPAGYNSIKPITFTVTANHTITWEGEDRDTILTSLSGNAASGEITFTPTDDKSELDTNVVNKPGSSLPETGGMGTIVLYAAGAVLVIAAGVYFGLKKKNAR